MLWYIIGQINDDGDDKIKEFDKITHLTVDNFL